MLLTAKAQVLARVVADDQTFLAEQARLVDFFALRKPCIAKQAWLVRNQKYQQRRQHTGQRDSARPIQPALHGRVGPEVIPILVERQQRGVVVILVEGHQEYRPGQVGPQSGQRDQQDEGKP